jgi:hypothetical protein
LRERILVPLGMSETSGGAATMHELSDLAGWHVVIDGKPVAIDTVFTDQYLASGGMVVSGRDATQWLRLQLNGGLVDGQQVIARDALLECHRPHAVATPGKDVISLFYPGARMAAYGLGWGVSDLEGHALVMHSGSDLGVQAQTLLLPGAGIGVAVYANSMGGGPAALSLAHAIAATLLGLKPRDWLGYFKSFAPAPPADTASALAVASTGLSENLGCYAGSYVHPADGPLDVRVEAGGLVGQLRDAYRLSFRLSPAGEHHFGMDMISPEWQVAAAGEAATLSFTIENGRATQAEISGFFAGRHFVRTEDR